MKVNSPTVIALVLWFLFFVSRAFAVFKSPYPIKAERPDQTIIISKGNVGPIADATGKPNRGWTSRTIAVHSLLILGSGTGGTVASLPVTVPAILWLLNDAASESPTSSMRHETERTAKFLLPAVLGMTAGAVDVTGFLGLGGLFTAHITGNLVILAAHYVTGSFGEIAPLLSAPVFVVVLGVITVMFIGKPIPFSRRALLVMQAVLLASFLGFGVGFGPFADPNSSMAVFVGMLGVAAMATQNAVVRLALAGHPVTTVMSTNAAQLAIDLATLARCLFQPINVSKIRSRAYVTALAVLGFVVGVVAGAILEIHFGLWSLTFPSLLAVLAVPLSESWTV